MVTLTTENLLSFIGIIGGLMAVWATWKKLKPERKKLEAEATHTNITSSALVADKALDLLEQMEKTLSLEQVRMKLEVKAVESRLVASQEEVTDLMSDVDLLKKVNDSKKTIIFQLEERLRVGDHYLKEYARAISELLSQFEELEVIPKYLPPSSPTPVRKAFRDGGNK